MSEKHIVVLGAGVIGLTSALFLAEADYKVTVIAAHVPGDKSIEYTSPWAGAHWLPHATVNEPEQCSWDVQTYDYWLELMERERREGWRGKDWTGLKMCDSYHFWDQDLKDEIWWAPHVTEFRQLSRSVGVIAEINERTPTEHPLIKHGAQSRAMCINVSQYLLYLQDRGRKLGVEVIKARLPVDSGFEAAIAAAESLARERQRGAIDCVVNCTGIGAFKLCGDKNVYPIRGQTVLVKGEANATYTRIGDGYSAYCIPRPGSSTTILGGTKEVDNWSEEPDPHTTERILRQNAWQVRDLLTAADGGFEIVSVQCGLRPGRRGGPRLEKETVGGKKVVHAYGHAGAGYQNSIGSARKVVRLVGESFGGHVKL